MLDFLKEDIKRFELDNAKASYLLIISFSKLIPPPLNYIIAVPFVLFLLAEFFPKLNAILGIALAIICLGAAGKIIHIDIAGIPSNLMLIIGIGTLSFGILWSLLVKKFQFNKLYIGLSFIVLLLGICSKITYVEILGTTGNSIIGLSALFLCVSYFYRFLLKLNKNFIDVLKVLIVWSYAAAYSFTILHLNYGFETMVFNSFLLVIWPLLFYYNKWKAAKPKY